MAPISTLREQRESIEQQILSPVATQSAHTQGRPRPETECDIRTAFCRDIDRIIYSKAFRRLKHKTQVFLHPEGDHYRTRLTHTLEVSRIARTIARGLRLNEDLTEAIALGHDLGHTPFGHAGERALDELYFDGFRHYDQSLRVVDRLEKAGRGLNLCHETRIGIHHHTKGADDDPLEARIVRLSDRVAYINHDADDAIRAGLLTEGMIPSEIRTVLGEGLSERINAIVTDIITQSTDKPDILMSHSITEAVTAFRAFMFETVYKDPIAKGEEVKVRDVLGGIFDHYRANPIKLPEDYRNLIDEDGLECVVKDYVSGMTDKFAMDTYADLFIPASWQIR
ncbi:MAG: deoxyguanosinetriphosphate triphosphohydrolase [Oscillospiraceae bacterium]|nr:deoxyguanosinetriphosphate triphosphohydrolase [Oscillospiraceae bacterium]